MAEQIKLTELENHVTPGRSAAIFARGTETEIRDQIRLCVEYAVTECGYDEHDYSNLPDAPESGNAIGDPNGESIGAFWSLNSESTTELKGLIQLVRDNRITDHVLVPHLTTISPSWRDVFDIIQRLTLHGVTVIVVGDDVTYSDENDGLDTLRAVANAERQDATNPVRRIGPDKHVGRPPIGYQGDGQGGINPTEEYDNIRSALIAVDEGIISPYQAAKETGKSRDAIKSALSDRRDLYDLDQ